MMNKSFTHVCITLLGLALFACSSGRVDTRTCGDNTQEIGGYCVSLMECGAGTRLIDGVCEFSPSVTCGEGTVLSEDNLCAREHEITGCGRGTVEVDGECLLESEPVECGEGTSEEEGLCLIDNPVLCGSNTEPTDDGLCIADTCGEGTITMEDGTCFSEEYAPPIPLERMCRIMSRNVCQSLGDCDCAPLPGASKLARTAYESQPLCEFYLALMCDVFTVPSVYRLASGGYSEDYDTISLYLSLFKADELCRMIANNLLGAGKTLENLALLDPATPNRGRCFETAACLSDNLACMPDPDQFAPGLACYPRLEAGSACARTEHCQADLYCNHQLEDPVCESRPTWGLACSHTDQPCTVDTCCIDGNCATLPRAGMPCCDDMTCGVGSQLYCLFSPEEGNVCRAYARVGESCAGDVRCARGFGCFENPRTGERICQSAINFCDYDFF